MATTTSYRPLAGSISQWANTIQNLNQSLKKPQLDMSGGTPVVKFGKESLPLESLVAKVYQFRHDPDIENYHKAAKKLASLIQKAPQEKTTLSSIIENFFVCCLCSSSCIKTQQRQRILADAESDTYTLLRKQSSDEFNSMLNKIVDEYELDEVDE